MTKELEENPSSASFEGAEAHLRQWLESRLPPEASVEALEEAKAVREAAGKLAQAAGISKPEAEALALAALFHRAGQAASPENGGLKKSQRLAEEFMQGQKEMEKNTAEVKRLLAALEPGREPSDELEKILLDAASIRLLSKKFDQNAPQSKAGSGKPLTETEAAKKTLKRLGKHTFHTHWAQELFGGKKEKSLKKAKKRLKKLEKAEESLLKASSISANSGARTMFKTALRNHIDLTAIADQKANIMLSVNALIVTIGLPAFSTYFAGKPYLLIPGLIFILTAIVTMVFATVATRPIKMSGETDLAKLKSGKTNLFFFGNFYRLKRGDYENAIKQVAADTDYLDSSYINDLYYLGLALGDKFRHLRTCYTIFATGIIVSAVAFGVAYFLHSAGE